MPSTPRALPPLALFLLFVALAPDRVEALQQEPIRGTVTAVAEDGSLTVVVDGDRLPEPNIFRFPEVQIGFDAGGVFVEVEGRWLVTQVDEDGFRVRPAPDEPHGEVSPGFEAVYDQPYATQTRQNYRTFHELAEAPQGNLGLRISQYMGIGDMEGAAPLIPRFLDSDDFAVWRAGAAPVAVYFHMTGEPERSRALYETYVRMAEAHAASGEPDPLGAPQVDLEVYYEFAERLDSFLGDEEAAIEWYVKAARGGHSTARVVLEAKGVSWEDPPRRQPR